MIIQGPLITLDYLTTIIWDFFPNLIDFKKKIFLDQYTEVCFASLLSGGFTTRYHLRIFQQLPHQTLGYLNGNT